ETIQLGLLPQDTPGHLEEVSTLPDMGVQTGRVLGRIQAGLEATSLTLRGVQMALELVMGLRVLRDLCDDTIHTGPVALERLAGGLSFRIRAQGIVLPVNPNREHGSFLPGDFPVLSRSHMATRGNRVSRRIHPEGHGLPGPALRDNRHMIVSDATLDPIV